MVTVQYFRRGGGGGVVGIRNSTGSSIFPDFQSNCPGSLVSLPQVKGNEDSGYEIDKPDLARAPYYEQNNKLNPGLN